jgi:hypothetical protein
MSNLVILPAPNIDTGNAPGSPWERERRAFHQLLPLPAGHAPASTSPCTKARSSPADATVSRWPWKPISGLVMSLCSSGWSPKRSRAGESAFLHRIRLKIHEVEPLNVEVLTSREELHVLLGRDVLKSQRIVPDGWRIRKMGNPP